MGDNPQSISDAELRYWHQWCQELHDRIIDTRLANKPVRADEILDYRAAGWGGRAVGVPSGLTIFQVIL